MILKRLKISTWIQDETNCYIIFDETSKETMVVDPAGEVDKIVQMIDILGGNLKYIFLTHCHGDHIAGVSELIKQKGGTVLIHREDSEGLNNKEINLTEFMDGLPEIQIDENSRVDDEDLIHIGDLEFKVIHTPGHTKGSCSLYLSSQKLLISGDTLFRGAWGRTDLPTSDFNQIIESITNKLLILPDDTIVYPGHRKVYYDRQ